MASFQELINQDKPVLVDFFATWCQPCKMMAPILEDVSRQVGDSASVLKVDVDRNPAAAGHYGVQGVPTLILFKKGKIVWKQAGVVPAHQLVKLIKEHL